MIYCLLVHDIVDKNFDILHRGNLLKLSTRDLLHPFRSPHMCRNASREMTRTCFGLIASSVLITPLSSGIGRGADSMM